MRTRLIGTVIFIAGAALLVAGAYVTYQRLDFLGRCSEARAVVVDLHWEEEYESALMMLGTLYGLPGLCLSLLTQERVSRLQLAVPLDHPLHLTLLGKKSIFSMILKPQLL